MSIATAIQNAQAKVAAAYSKCNDKGATMPTAANQNLSHLADTIDSIPTGGGASIEEKDVNFIDYDGTVVYTYTAAEFANLSALPANPSHDGLTAQGWNWTLSDAKTYVAKYGMLEIGQNYITTDGKTRIYISITEWEKPIKFYYTQSTTNLVTVDWGDGSSTQKSSSTSASLTHTYANAGDYVITMYASSGSYSLSRSSCTMFDNQSSQYANYYLITKGILIGSNVVKIGGGLLGAKVCGFFSIPTSVTTIDTSAFRNMTDGSAGIVIPSGCTAIGQYAFTSFSGRVSLPKSVASIAQQAFYNATFIPRLSLPENVTYGATPMQSAKIQRLVIGEGVTDLTSYFANVDLCREIVVPEGVTTISGDYVLGGSNISKATIASTVTDMAGYSVVNSTIVELIMLPTTPPAYGYSTIPSTSSLLSQFKMYVPHGCLSAYQSATGWSAYASKMVEMPA